MGEGITLALPVLGAERGHPGGLRSSHSERSEESPPGRANEILRFAQNDDILECRTQNRKSHHTIVLLEPIPIDGQPVLAVAQAAMDFRIDRIADRLHGTVAERHVESAGVRAAEGLPGVHARPVLHGRVAQGCDAVLVGDGSGVHRQHIAARYARTVRRAGKIPVRPEIFFADKVSVAQSIADVGDRYLAALEADAGETDMSAQTKPAGGGSVVG